MANEKKPTRKNEPFNKEEARRSKEEQNRRARRRMRQLIGFALTILIVVGAISIVQRGVDVAKEFFDDTNEMDVYEKRIAPLVWFDVLPFESLSEADPNALRQAVIWGVLNELGSEVSYDDMGRPLVPAVEVDRYAAELFGPDVAFEHTSFEDPVQDLTYEYDPISNMYAATATGLTPPYMPTVVQIERLSGGVRQVTVGYVTTMNSENELIATPDLSKPSKYMDYFFRRDGSEYYLYALRNNTSYVPPEDETASSSVSVPQSVSMPLIGDDSSMTNSVMQQAELQSQSASFSEVQDGSSGVNEAESTSEADSSTSQEEE